MQIVITPANISDQIDIDSFLQETQFSTPYHRLQWVVAIRQAYGHEYEYLLARKNNKIVGLLPLTIFRKLTGKKELCSLPFCDVGGVVTEDNEVRIALIQYVQKNYNQQRTLRFEIRQRSIEIQQDIDMTNRKVSMILELPESSDLLLSSFKSKLRSQIRKADKNGLEFNYANNAESIDHFFSVFSRNMHVLGSPTHSIKWFHSLREIYQEDLLVGRVWFEGKIVGSGILLFSGNRVSIPWASTLREFNRLAPNMLLYWNLLRVSCERGCNEFDFGRSTFGEGTYKFKQQWGAKPVLLDWKYLDKQGLEMEAHANTRISSLRSAVENVWKKLPLSFVNFIGPRLRRHISL